MKTLIFASIILSSLIPSVADAKIRSRNEETYITEKTYIKSSQTIFGGCMGEKDDHAYCMCATSAIVSNMRLTTSVYELVYESELMQHVNEFAMSQEQSKQCE